MTNDKKWVAKDRLYKLKGNFAPPLRQIRTRHLDGSPLMVWDEEAQENRALRYYRGAKTPYLADQPETGVVVGHVFFREGVLYTDRTDIALQQFLDIHPDKDRIFYEVVPEQNAEKQVVEFEARATAYEAVKKLTLDEIEALSYNEIGDAVFKTSTKELKRDLWVIADEEPAYLLEAIDDKHLVNKFIARKAERFEIIKVTDGGRTIKWSKSGRKICAVPVDESPYSALSSHFLTDDGVAVATKIKEELKKFE